MKKIVKTVYSINELSEVARERAINDYVNNIDWSLDNQYDNILQVGRLTNTTARLDDNLDICLDTCELEESFIIDNPLLYRGVHAIQWINDNIIKGNNFNNRFTNCITVAFDCFKKGLAYNGALSVDNYILFLTRILQKEVNDYKKEVTSKENIIKMFVNDEALFYADGEVYSY